MNVKKYQFFISSTYTDLIDERRMVMETVINLGHMPIGMELFNASDDSQWEYIKRKIDETDYYILILGDRYGSLDSDGVGFTEKEYRYALSKEVPIITFLMSDDLIKNLQDEKRESKHRDKLLIFKELVSKKLCKIWRTKYELVNYVTIGIIELMDNNPRCGWVRGTFVTNAISKESSNIPSSSNNSNLSNYDMKEENNLDLLSRENEHKLYELAKRLIELMKGKEVDILMKIFRESIAKDIAKYIKEIILKKLEDSTKEDIQLTLEEVYVRSNKDLSMEAEIIREHCCHYMCFLQTPSSKNFLFNILLKEKSQFVRRGIYMGIILMTNDNQLLVKYLQELNSNPLVASINAGYHQCYYGDKFFNEGYLFSENNLNRVCK